jgi:hypothetical protein
MWQVLLVTDPVCRKKDIKVVDTKGMAAAAIIFRFRGGNMQTLAVEDHVDGRCYKFLSLEVEKTSCDRYLTFWT